MLTFEIIYQIVKKKPNVVFCENFNQQKAPPKSMGGASIKVIVRNLFLNQHFVNQFIFIRNDTHVINTSCFS
jgi:hypothetical protein